MANIAYFEIPADNVDRAKKFYHALFGWKIEPTKSMGDPAKMKAALDVTFSTLKTVLMVGAVLAFWITTRRGPVVTP